MSGQDDTIKGTFLNLANELKSATINTISKASDAIKDVAPVLWRTIKMKVIGDAVALIIVASTITGLICWLWLANKIIITIGFIAAAFIIASSVKRILASDFYTLMEIINTAGNTKKEM